MNLLKVSCVLFACMGAASAAPSQSRQSDASWRAAFGNQSSAPSYAMFTVIDGNTGVARLTCTEANFLLGALIEENEWPSDNEARLSALHIALTDQTRVFTFNRRKALDNLPRYFTDDELAHVRWALAGLSTQQVLDATQKHGPGSLDDLFKGEGWSRYPARRDAVACVLMERGESPGIADITGQIYVRGVPREPAQAAPLSRARQKASSSP